METAISVLVMQMVKIFVLLMVLISKNKMLTVKKAKMNWHNVEEKKLMNVMLK